ncbi:late competence development ComFB family protein [Pseudoalteromonas sp. SSDWG2]|uniref:late competence development ComFB family protein n=1 Tax=Pseudoalteromonas sp. SSDWG2 TaxID=3139391 RepID=UPI003BAB2C72
MIFFEDVHNYYEKLVAEEIGRQQLYQVYDNNTLADICCAALSQLPPRYIRSDVDMAFYLSSDDASMMQDKVAAAIEVARGLISRRGTDAEYRQTPR